MVNLNTWNWKRVVEILKRNILEGTNWVTSIQCVDVWLFDIKWLLFKSKSVSGSKELFGLHVSQEQNKKNSVPSFGPTRLSTEVFPGSLIPSFLCRCFNSSGCSLHHWADTEGERWQRENGRSREVTAPAQTHSDFLYVKDGKKAASFYFMPCPVNITPVNSLNKEEAIFCMMYRHNVQWVSMCFTLTVTHVLSGFHTSVHHFSLAHWKQNNRPRPRPEGNAFNTM